MPRQQLDYIPQWESRPRRDGLLNIYIKGTEHDVCLCVRPRDASLIEAAPDLLAALELLLDVALQIDDEVWAKTEMRLGRLHSCIPAYKALKKARGD